jgi:hypothetical protein
MVAKTSPVCYYVVTDYQRKAKDFMVGKRMDFGELLDMVDFEYTVNADGSINLIDKQDAYLGDKPYDNLSVKEAVGRLDSEFRDYILSGCMKTLEASGCKDISGIGSIAELDSYYSSHPLPDGGRYEAQEAVAAIAHPELISVPETEPNSSGKRFCATGCSLGVSVMHGTLSSFPDEPGSNAVEADLVPAFLAALRHTCDYQKLLDDIPAGAFLMKKGGTLKTDRFAELVPDERSSFWTDGRASEFLNGELFDALGSYAPDGWYFGSIAGAGSDFGFWKDEDHSPDHDLSNEESSTKHEKALDSLLADRGFQWTIYDDGSGHFESPYSSYHASFDLTDIPASYSFSCDTSPCPLRGCIDLGGGFRDLQGTVETQTAFLVACEDIRSLIEKSSVVSAQLASPDTDGERLVVLSMRPSSSSSAADRLFKARGLSNGIAGIKASFSDTGILCGITFCIGDDRMQVPSERVFPAYTNDELRSACVGKMEDYLSSELSGRGVYEAFFKNAGAQCSKAPRSLDFRQPDGRTPEGICR